MYFVKDKLKISHCSSLLFLDILDFISADCFCCKLLPFDTSIMVLSHYFHRISSEYSYTNEEILSRRCPYTKQNHSYFAGFLFRLVEYLCWFASREILRMGHMVHRWSACWLKGCDSCWRKVASISS